MGYEFYMNKAENSYWLTERVHKPFVLWIQSKIERFIRNKYAGRKEQIKVGVEMPRIWGKTQCVSVPAGLALFLEFPNLGWADGSESAEKAAELMIESQRAILSGVDDNAWFCWLYGLWLKPGAGQAAVRRPNQKTFFTHEARTDLARQDQSVRCWGVQGGITGKHPDGGTMDDPVSEERIREGEGWLAVASNHMNSMFFAFQTSCIVFFPHTRYRDNDPAGTRFRDEGVKEWAGDPCPDSSFVVSETGQWEVYYIDCYDENGHSKCPEIETTRSLWLQETSNPVTFSAQKRNQPGRGTHQLITAEQMRACLVHKNELPQSGDIYIQCREVFSDLNALGTQESVVSVILQDPRANGVVYFLEGYGDKSLRVEDYVRLVCRLVVKAQNDVNWKRYRLAGITDATPARSAKDRWTLNLKQFGAAQGLWLPRVIELPRPKGARDQRVVNCVGYALDKRFKIVDGAPNSHRVVSTLVTYNTKRGSGDEQWAILASEAFDEEIYKPALRVQQTGVSTMHSSRRNRRVDSEILYDGEIIYDEPDYVG